MGTKASIVNDTHKRRHIYVIVGIIICICAIILGYVLIHKKSSDSDNYTEPVEDGNFIYSDDKKTNIIGLSEDGMYALDLVFPENVTSIENITIPNDSALKRVYFLNANVKLKNVSFAGTRVQSVNLIPTTVKTIPENFFNGCSNLNTIGDEKNVVTLPESVKSIESGAFSGCTSITKINLNKVNTINSYAFQGCTNLSDVIWSNELSNIGDAAFFGTGLKTVTLPDSVNSLGAIVFLNCKNLETLNINNVESVGQELCKGCTNLKEFTAKKNFEILVSEESDNSNATYDKLFDKNATIKFNVAKNSEIDKYVKTLNK